MTAPPSRQQLPRRLSGRERACLATTLLALALPQAALAATPCPDDFVPLDRVTMVTEGGELVLEKEGRVRLAAIDLAGGDAADRQAFISTLRDMAAGRPISLATAREGTDRHGRLDGLVRVKNEAGESVLLQAALLERGLVVARPEPGYLGCMTALFVAERPARAINAGRWAQLPIPVENIAALRARQGDFTLMEGRVLAVGSGRGVDYLNFGDVWRKDATVRIEKDIASVLAARGVIPAQAAGRHLTVRGHVIEAGGPLIDVHWAEQVDISEITAPEGGTVGRQGAGQR